MFRLFKLDFGGCVYIKIWVHIQYYILYIVLVRLILYIVLKTSWTWLTLLQIQYFSEV